MNYAKILIEITEIISEEEKFNKKLVELIEERNEAILKALIKIQKLK